MNSTFGLEYQPQPAAVALPPLRTALLVDDDPLQLEVLEYRLRQLGFHASKLLCARISVTTPKPAIFLWYC